MSSLTMEGQRIGSVRNSALSIIVIEPDYNFFASFSSQPRFCIKKTNQMKTRARRPPQNEVVIVSNEISIK